jgi:hypothetical protein
MLDAVGSLAARPAPALAVETLMRGKRHEEVASLLPRMFNLCRTAQQTAVRLALDLPHAAGEDALRREILRDHVLRLAVVLPGHFGQSPPELPPGWRAGGNAVRRALFGPACSLPADFPAFASWRDAATTPLAALVRRVDGLLRPGEASAGRLPRVRPATALDPHAAVENSCAGRASEHPLLGAIEAELGRGPVWRLMGRMCDLERRLGGDVPEAWCPAPGIAHVAASRGLYSVRAEFAGDRVAAFARVTPTDHLQAPGGVLERSLATLPADRAGLAPLLLDILDPCLPIRLEEAAHA